MSRGLNSFDGFQGMKAYNPQDCKALDLFSAIKQNIECPFAKRSRLWGSPEWDSAKSLEENVEAFGDSLSKFVNIAISEGLDGYVIAAPEVYGRSIEDLSVFTKKILIKLNSMSPILPTMNQNFEDPNWRFSYGGTSFFVTTFAPCYPKSNSRYAWGTGCTFILLQPEHSFDSANIPKGHGAAIRDVIRMAFKRNDRAYYDPKIIDAASEAIKYVKPLKLGSPPVEWWKAKA